MCVCVPSNDSPNTPCMRQLFILFFSCLLCSTGDTGSSVLSTRRTQEGLDCHGSLPEVCYGENTISGVEAIAL